MRDFHLMNSRKNEQSDQAGRTLFFGDKRVPNLFFYSERLMDHSHSYIHDSERSSVCDGKNFTAISVQIQGRIGGVIFAFSVARKGYPAKNHPLRRSTP